MNIELIPTTKPQPERVPLEIQIDGKSYGMVEPRDKGAPWHAQIKLPVPSGSHWREDVLIQGHADTPEEAVAAAFRDGLAYHQNCVKAIESFAGLANVL